MSTEVDGKAVNYKCPGCGADIPFSAEKQCWVCSYCGGEFQLEELEKSQKENVVKKDILVEDKDVYRCESCGAEIIADENMTATFCVYCGNTAILKDRIHNSRVPDYIIPFKKVKDDAVKAFVKVVKYKPLVPREFKTKKNIEKITGIYIPFWAYDFYVSGKINFSATDIHTWSDVRNRYTKTDRFNVTCSGEMSYDKVLADGSSRFSDDLMDSLEPFDYQGLISYNQAFLAGFLSEKYDVDNDTAILRAKERTVNTTISLVKEKVRHQTSTMTSHSLDIKNNEVNYILLPVFMVNTKFHDKQYTFAMNGQTGKIVGDLPISLLRVILWSLGIYLVCFLIMLGLYLGGVI